MKASDALAAAAIIIGRGWTQHQSRQDGRYCALGALIVACDGDWDLYWRAARTLAELVPVTRGRFLREAHCVTCWNDSLDPASGQQVVKDTLLYAARHARYAGD